MRRAAGDKNEIPDDEIYPSFKNAKFHIPVNINQ
jgi:hypothetical protein